MGIKFNPFTKTFDFTGSSSPAPSPDEQVKISLNDAIAGYLNGKLVAGTGITLTEINDGGNETLEVSSSVTATPGGSNLQVQFNNAGVFGGLNGSSVDQALQRLGIQVALPLAPLHVVGAVGQTVSPPASGSVSLVPEVSVSAPSGSITAIAELPAPSSGGISFIDSGSGNFYADGSTYTYRITPLLYANGAYYRSSSYIDISSTDPSDSSSYNVYLDWDDVIVSGESVYYLIERDINGSGFSDYAQVATSDFTDSGSGSGTTYNYWPSFYQNTGGGSGPSAPNSFDYAVQQYDGSNFYYYASGQSILYEIDQYKNILGTDYVSGSPVQYSFSDDSSGNYYYVDLGWTFGGSTYDGVILRKSFDGGSSWTYQKLDAGSYPGYFSDYNYSDDGNGFIWGNTYSGGGGSSIVYAFDPYGRGVSPSGNIFYSSIGSPYNISIPADSIKYILKHNLGGVPAGGAKIIAPSGAGTNGKVVSASFYDVGYSSWGDGLVVTPTGYGFTGTAQNRDYRIYAYQNISGQNIYSSSYLTLSTTAVGGSQSVSGSFSAVPGATGYKIFRQVNGGGFSALTKVTGSLVFTDDVSDTLWNQSSVVTPTTAIAEVVRIDRATTSATDAAHLDLVATGSGIRYTSIGFGTAADSASGLVNQAYIQHSSSTGYLDLVTNRVQIPSTRGGTPTVMLGTANIFNNSSSSSIHFQVKGQLDASLINTRSDMNTVGFGSALATDPQAVVQIQPARSGDTGLVLKGHSGHSTASSILRIGTSAGSYNGEITVGGYFRAGTGAVSTPSHSFYSDNNTGIYGPSADQMGFVTGGVERLRLDSSGRLGIGLTTLTAKLHIAAGSATAGTAPIKMTSGTLLTTAEVGAHEFLTDKYYGTITTGAARKEFTLNDIALTTGRIPFTTTNGRLTDSANLQFASNTLTLGEAINLAVGTTTGTKMATATTQKLGFWNATPVVQNTGWSVTNVTPDKSFDADATSVNELADVVGTLIDTLKAYGILGA